MGKEISAQFITCPKCGTEIPLTEALTRKIEESIRSDLERVFREREKRLLQKEKEVEEASRRIEEEREKIKAALEKEFEKERKKLRKSLEEEVRKDFSVELEELKRELEEEKKEVRQLKKKELELRREREKLKKKEEMLELEVARKVDEERERIREEALKTFREEHRLKERKKDVMIQSLREQVEELKRKLEQGSQQVQGEVLELEIEEVLKENFPGDEIIPVSKGKRGADIVHKVRDPAGKVCGTIVWESKNTKHWQHAWITKIKEDLRKAKGDVAVIVSIALPEGIEQFGQVEGVWVSGFSHFLPLAFTLRTHLVELARVKVSLEGVKGKKDLIYRYVSGNDFRQRVESVVEAIVEMKQDLDRERAAFERMFSKREKQILRLAHGMAGMYGDIQGIVGKTLPDIELLKLPEGE